MIAEYRFDTVTQSHAATQHIGRCGAAVYQISQQIYRVPAWGEADLLQQSGEGTFAALYILSK